MKTIVVGYDDTEPSMRALQRVIELAKAFGADVVAVSAARPLAPAGRGIGPIDPTDPPELHREELRRAKAFLTSRTSRLASRWVSEIPSI